MRKNILARMERQRIIAVVGAGYLFLQTGFDATGRLSLRWRSPPSLRPGGGREQSNVLVYARHRHRPGPQHRRDRRRASTARSSRSPSRKDKTSRKSDALFQIDPAALPGGALDQASSNRAQNEAKLKRSPSSTSSATSRPRPRAMSPSRSRDEQQARVDALKGQIAADEAVMRTGPVSTSSTPDIRAPFDGRTGTRLVDVGNLVQAAQATSLVSITQIKPIYVNFTVPQDVNEARAAHADIRRSAGRHRLRRQGQGTGARHAVGRRQPDRDGDRARCGRTQGDLREHRRASVAGPVRQCPPQQLEDPRGRRHRPAARRHARLQRLFQLRRAGRRHGRATRSIEIGAVQDGIASSSTAAWHPATRS